MVLLHRVPEVLHPLPFPDFKLFIHSFLDVSLVNLQKHHDELCLSVVMTIIIVAAVIADVVAICLRDIERAGGSRPAYLLIYLSIRAVHHSNS